MDLSLYLVTDRPLSRGRATVDVVREAVAGGVTCVQLREKNCSVEEFIGEARQLHGFLRPLGIPLIINDSVEVAAAVGAEGLHLGQQDMPLEQARKVLPSCGIIGISAESLEDAIRAEEQGADYIGVSPVFATPTKTDTAPPLGLDGLRAIRAAVKIPLVAIGGIHAENAREVVRAGADGLAVVSAIVSAGDPRAAAAELRRKIDFAKGERA